MTRTAVAAIAVAALAGLLYTLNRIDDVAVVATTVDDRLPRYTLSNAELTRYDADGEAALKATASSLEYFDDESAQATTLVLDVLSGARTPWHITAPTGTLAPGSRVMTLSGNVIADGQWPDNGEAVTVRSPTMKIDPDAHLLSTDADVSADSRTRKGTATGMTANWTQQDLRLLNNVKMRYEVNR